MAIEVVVMVIVVMPIVMVIVMSIVVMVIVVEEHDAGSKPPPWVRVTVVAVVIVAAAVWISSIENDFKITISSCIKLSLAGPPIQGLLIMRPRASPICLIATKPKVIS